MMVVRELMLLLALLRAYLAVAQDITVDICVIGAGPAGIQAAYSAEAKGRTVAVFEKNSYVGGKTKTIPIANSAEPYYMGAAIHFDLISSSLESLFRKFGVEAIQELPPGQYYKGGNFVDYSLNYVQLLFQGIKYFLKTGILGHHINGPAGLLSHYPKELNQPMQNWLNNNHMPYLNDVLWEQLTTYGYGHTKDIPAIYALKAAPAIVSLSYSIFYLLPFIHEKIGHVRIVHFQQLLQRMADSLDGTVYLGVNITNVSYETDSNIMTFSLQGNATTRTARCGATIIAFPPISSAMPVFTPPEDSGALSDLFVQIKTSNYYTLLLEDAQGDFGDKVALFHHVPESDIPDNPALNLLLSKQQNFPSAPVVAYYLTPSEKTNEQALSESLVSYFALSGRPVNVSIVQDFNNWDTYFPHVSTESLNDGFYHKFDTFQGRSRQYYVGGLFNFESVQTSMEHGRYIVEKNF